VARQLDRYKNEIVPALVKEFGYTNPMEVPHVVKVVLNMGLGEAIQNVKLIDAAREQLGAISGQRPVVCRARRSIATYKLRAGMPIGVKVTLRRAQMSSSSIDSSMSHCLVFETFAV